MASLRDVWLRRRAGLSEQVGVIEAAVGALERGGPASAECEAARAVAHRLAGSLGTFGIARASEHARRIERLLGDGPAGRPDATVLAPLVGALRHEVEAADVAAAPAVAAGAADDDGPLVLVIEDDEAFRDALALEGRRAGLRVEGAGSVEQARELLARVRPDGVVLDLVLGDGTADAYALLSELEQTLPGVPVLVSTVLDALGDRVEVARRGARGFVTKTRAPGEVVEQILGLIERARAGAITLLAVDDDPALLDAVGALLSGDGLRVVALADPLRLWDELERVTPDLVLLDVEMPDVNGIELCRVLRNDPQWASIPILVLTSRRDAATIERIFAAGADDYLAKPVLEAELRVRVRNRVERLQLHRTLADTDRLSGVANRHAAWQAMERLLRLARRNEQPFSFALLDLDRFKLVNDGHGHPAGDEVLRRFGRMLRRAFRGEDVVGRFGGEEFAVGMYGSGAADVAGRLEQLLATFGEQRFAGAGGEPFRVGFSAGVACAPRDGEDLEALQHAADAALYEAKAAGRGRVHAAHPAP